MGSFRKWLEAKIPYLQGVVQEAPPPTKEATIGIEIEFLMPRSSINRPATNGITRNDEFLSLKYLIDRALPAWELTLDPSVKVEPGDPKGLMNHLELKSGILQWDKTEDELEDAIRWLEDHAAYMNRRCGIHFHVNLWTQYSQPPAWFIFNIVSHIDEKGLAKEFPTRFEDPEVSDYTKPVRGQFAHLLRTLSKEKKELAGISPDDIMVLGGMDRYWGVNLDSLYKHGTIEFRYFGKKIPGVINLGDVLVPLRYVKSVVHKAATTPYKFGKHIVGGSLPPKEDPMKYLASLPPKTLIDKYIRGDGGLNKVLEDARYRQTQDALILLTQAWLKNNKSPEVMGKQLVETYRKIRVGRLSTIDREIVYQLLVGLSDLEADDETKRRKLMMAMASSPVFKEIVLSKARKTLESGFDIEPWLKQIFLDYPELGGVPQEPEI